MEEEDLIGVTEVGAYKEIGIVGTVKKYNTSGLEWDTERLDGMQTTYRRAKRGEDG